MKEKFEEENISPIEKESIYNFYIFGDEVFAVNMTSKRDEQDSYGEWDTIYDAKVMEGDMSNPHTVAVSAEEVEKKKPISLEEARSKNPKLFKKDWRWPKELQQ